MSDTGTNGWSRYEREVMHRLETLDVQMESVNEKLARISVDIAMLKVKSGLWGAAAGLVPAGIVVATTLIR